MYPMRYNTAIRILKIFLLNFLFHILLWSLTWLWLESRQDTDRSSANGGILRHRQTLVYSLQFYSVSTTVMKSFCKKPLLDVVLKSQVVVRFLRYWSKKGIMYHVLNFMSQYCYHSVLALQPRNTMLSLLEEATMDWWLQVTLQDVGWRLLCWRGGMSLVRSD